MEHRDSATVIFATHFLHFTVYTVLSGLESVARLYTKEKRVAKPRFGSRCGRHCCVLTPYLGKIHNAIACLEARLSTRSGGPGRKNSCKQNRSARVLRHRVYLSGKTQSKFVHTKERKDHRTLFNYNLMSIS